MPARKSAAMFANACGFDPGNSEDTISPMKAVVYTKYGPPDVLQLTSQGLAPLISVLIEDWSGRKPLAF